ncbi:MAG: hypothetical protein LBP58_05885 [Azoarcus sp.]|jgi:uncharacterized protein YaaW (UPF0174 family)|nr:hypothetical protein [Azoarcus sp.]
MKAILNKCTKKDFEFLSETLDSYLSFTNDRRRKELLAASDDHVQSREQLVELMDKQIKYYGSSDIAYLKRAIFGDGGGVEFHEIVDDVCAKFKIKNKRGRSIESRLESLVNSIVDKELLSKTPEELSSTFKKMGVGDHDQELILEHIKKRGKVAVLSILAEILGPEVTLGISETIVVSLIAQILGSQAVKKLLQEIIKRYPGINALLGGPVLWVLSGTWLAFDLQVPAYRKTIPICLYLGIVALRDGEEAA